MLRLSGLKLCSRWVPLKFIQQILKGGNCDVAFALRTKKYATLFFFSVVSIRMLISVFSHFIKFSVVD